MRLNIATTLIALMATLGTAMAQDTVEDQSKYYSSKPDQWFVGIGVGVQTYFSYDNYRYGYSKLITPAFSANFGKMFSRQYGVRGSVYGYKSVMYSDYNRYTPGGVSYFQKYIHNYVGFNADFYLNLTNIFGSKKDTPWNWMAFVGPGIELASPNVDRLESMINISAGLGLKYQLTKCWSIDLEGRLLATSSLFLNQGRTNIDGIGMVTAGVTYSFGGNKPYYKYKDKYVEAYTQSIAKSKTITAQNAALEIKNAETKRLQKALSDKEKELAACLKTPGVASGVRPTENVVSSSKKTPAEVFLNLEFGSNSAKLTKEHNTAIEQVAERLKKNPNSKIAVIAYGDYNPKMKLSESTLLSFQRGNTIVNILKNKYKIDSKRIRFVNKGDHDKSSVHLANTVQILDDNN